MDQASLINVITKAHEVEQPFVLFRYPEENQLKAYIQSGDVLNRNGLDTVKGFVFAPFNDQDNSIIFNSESCRLLHAKQELRPKKEGLTSFIEEEQTRINHENLIKKAITQIKLAKLEKVVISRKIEMEIRDLDFMGLFLELLHYKNAFVYCWYHPKVGMWLGASPETLIAIDGNNFSTMALAATKRLGKETLVWSEKEKTEQYLVSQYLSKQLIDFKLDKSKPYTVNAGNVAHIRTDIKGKLNRDSRLSDVLNKIHPTPAVCGIPMQTAKAFILKNESYDRAFYTGYMGEVNVLNKTCLQVNLRCMQYANQMATIYAGGGITMDSDPHDEWQETILKSQLLLGHLEKNR